LLAPSAKAAELTPTPFARERFPSKRGPDYCGRLATARAEPRLATGDRHRDRLVATYLAVRAVFI
jgi:hypothetical protein